MINLPGTKNITLAPANIELMNCPTCGRRETLFSEFIKRTGTPIDPWWRFKRHSATGTRTQFFYEAYYDFCLECQVEFISGDILYKTVDAEVQE